MHTSRLVVGALTLILTLAGIPADAQAPEGAKYTPLFEALWTTVDSNFYDPSYHGLNWKKIGERYRARLGTVQNDAQFEKLATQMLDDLGTSHLYIVPPSSSSASGVGIGVRFRTIGEAQFASDVAPLSDARVKGLRLGDRLVSAKAALSGAPGSLATVEVEGCNGALRSAEVKRVGAFWPPQHPAFEWHSVTVAPKQTIGYIRIDRFDDGAAALADQAMAELKDTEALIIDVRANSGGNLSALRLGSYFSGPQQIAVALLARDYLKTLHHPVTKADVEAAPKVKGAYTDEAIFAAIGANNGGATFMTDDLGDMRYTKPVIVLIGEDTGSAGEGFAWQMRLQTKAKLAGRTTAGALLSGQTFDLPDGWKLTVPVQGVWGADGTDFRDKAVKPDVHVAWTRAELCAGRDPDIEKALAILNAPAGR